MNGLYSVITDSTCKGGGGGGGSGIDASRNVSRGGGKPLGGPKNSVKGGPHNFYVVLRWTSKIYRKYVNNNQFN